MSEGWVKLHRSLLKWEWGNDMRMVGFWAFLLLMSNHDSRKWQGKIIQRGQMVTSLANLAAQTGLTVQTVRTFLKRLKSTHEITYESTHRFTTISICNYDQYQTVDKDVQHTKQQASQQTTNKPSTSHQQATNNKQELKNLRIKEVKKRKEKENFVNHPPIKTETLPALKQKKTPTLYTKGAITREQFLDMLADPKLCDGDREFLKFNHDSMDDWSNGNGKKRSDWNRALRNWIRRTRVERNIHPHQGLNNKPKTFTELEDEYQKEQGRKFLQLVGEK